VDDKKAVKTSANPMFTKRAVAVTLATLLPHRADWTPQRGGFAVTVTGDLPDGTSWQQTIRLASRPCPFGGWRHFLACPRCGGPVMALYWSPDFSFFFVCRGCAGLRYFTKNWNGAGRLWPRYDVLASGLRHRPGVKPSRYFRYDLLAKVNFARDLMSMMRGIETREREAQTALRALSGRKTPRAPR
jgi:hypothetical protein